MSLNILYVKHLPLFNLNNIYLQFIIKFPSIFQLVLMFAIISKLYQEECDQICLDQVIQFIISYQYLLTHSLSLEVMTILQICSRFSLKLNII